MHSWTKKSVTVRSKNDSRLFATLVLSQRTRNEGLKLVSLLIPGRVLSWSAGKWTEDNRPFHQSEWVHLADRLRGPDADTLPATPFACEAAALSGAFFAKHRVPINNLEIHLLDVSGCVKEDATPFALAATVGVIAIRDPKSGFLLFDPDRDWDVSDVHSI